MAKNLSSDWKSAINQQIQESSRIKLALQEKSEVIEAIAKELIKAFKKGNKVLLCGNGGSAADAQHLAAELAGKFYFDREPLPAIALTTNSSIITAIGNDFGYDEVFARQVRALTKAGDVVIGISTSGNSKNVLLALIEAKLQGARTIAISGQDGKINELADICLSVPSKDTPRIQEAHIMAGHIICYIVEKTMFDKLENDISDDSIQYTYSGL